ncbi:MAG: radical SAM protein [Verrucomicrobiota bacterium]
MKDLFLFVRPPRPVWPFNGPGSSFWPPLAFASMAAALRESIHDLQVAILDAPALQMGWRSLEAEVRHLQPAFVGIGEEAVSCVEGLRLAALAKSCGARVIGGGCFFGHVAVEALGTGLFDVIVQGEGEATIVELVAALRSMEKRDLRQVAGISFLEDDAVIRTPPRRLLPDLDRLPFPAYDLLPVERYGQGSVNHPGLAAIELSRGCFGSCSFCVLWRQMGRFQDSRLVPQLRAKTPERLLEKIRILVRKYGRRYLGWVDPCFNAHPETPARLAELLLKENLAVGQSAWVRADGILRDAASGALAACVRAGLNEVYLGIERPDSDSLRLLQKTVGPNEVRECLRILARDYPHVFTLGSFIYGLPGDTPKEMRAIYQRSLELDLDKAVFIPLTPLPGTPFWQPELWDPTGQRFRSFDFLPGSSLNGQWSSLEWALITSFVFDWRPLRLRRYFQAFFNQDARKRRIAWRLFTRSLGLDVRRTFEIVCRRGRAGGMQFPAWYNH